ncbi:hypothetical protein ASD15_08575 [Massilia sp. Root351]|uniref:DUF3999 family protein n=1 Tax=Massilia sp. Root351 TaxID=1736522 RepID=UPI000710E445|nr:DUF3999 family protein [Massilia sp. Root351]KQV85158.1 hypothetical protein ASD15_08575 [Massilia sp. Root351]
MSALLRRAAAAALLLAGACHAAAPADSAAGYSHTIPLNVQKDSGLAALRLPQQVYLASRSRSLDDLRVFDRDGASVPFALLAPPAPTHTTVADLPVRVFPLRSVQSGDDGAAGRRLDIRTDGSGRLLSVASSPAFPAAARQESLSRLILEVDAAKDAQGQPPPVSALRFELPPGTRSYSAQLWLETSSDLQRWEPAGAAELSWLSNADAQTLSNSRMAIQPARFRYARLSWRSGTPLVFARIVAETESTADAGPPMDTLTLQPTVAKNGTDLVYRSGIAIPAERIGMQFEAANAVFPVTLGRYESAPRRHRRRQPELFFVPVLNTTFYRITQEGMERKSGDAAIAATHTDTWVAKTEQGATARPALRISWTPSTLLLLANGKGPYQLAYGRDGAESSALLPSQIAPGFSADELRALPQAHAALTVAPAGHGAPAPSIAAGLPGQQERQESAATVQRTAILWSVLLAGLALLAYFVRTLLRQMNGSEQGREKQN